MQLLHIAHTVPCTDAEGPGRRFAIWFQGCPMRCPGCCNPEMLPFDGGVPLAVDDLLRDIRNAQNVHAIEGITLLGGEPFAQPIGAAALARGAQRLGLSVMVFSGYTIEEIRARPDPATADLLTHTDLLIDGPYLRDQPETQRRWIGSANQRIHCLTHRYRADDPCWRQRNTLELRFQNGELTLNGFPLPSQREFWRGLQPLKTL